jgi:hypothetical protein
MRSPILSLPSRNMKVNAIEVLNLRRWRGGLKAKGNDRDATTALDARTG